MATTTVSIRLDPELKKTSEAMLSEMGLSLSTLVSMLLRQMQRDRAIPFQVSLDQPNRETVQAMLEAERIANDKNAPYYTNAHDAIKAALAED